MIIIRRRSACGPVILQPQTKMLKIAIRSEI
jgi:hypothetical protein